MSEESRHQSLSVGQSVDQEAENEAAKNGQLSEDFSEEKFWAKLARYAASAGKDVVEVALKLFYALQDSDTPATAKAVIIGALAYFIIPTDAVADFLPGGYVDDWGALMGAVWTVAKHIKQEHSDKAKAKLQTWFPDAKLDKTPDNTPDKKT